MNKQISYIKQSFTLLLCGALSFSAKANDDAVNRFVSSPQFKHASIGLVVKDLNSNNIIASHNPDLSLTPASILKVVTTASAVKILGEDFRFKTTLATDLKVPTKLIIRGYGDPTLGSEYIGEKQQNLFWNVWTNRILKHTKSKELDILVVDDYFGYNGQSRKWIKEDMGNYYAAGAYGISIYDNTYRLYFNTSDGTAEILRTSPYMKDMTFTNDLGLNDQNKDNGYILGEPFSNKRRIIGDIPRAKNSFSIKGDIPDPGLLLAQTLCGYLHKNNLTINSVGTVRTNPQEYTEDIFYTHQSPPLKDIIKVINIRSNNHYSEHVIRAIGRSKDSKSDPLIEGIEHIKSLWRKNGIDTDGLFMYDGCGLAPSNAVNASFICDILVLMKDNSTFVNSLPKAGREGTVCSFLKGTKLEGKVIVKSGSIGKVQCFAGYYINGDKRYAFTVMVNNFNGSHREAVKAIEKLLINIF